LIWLAIYAIRHHWLALRLEEDYGYKETISRSFEGYAHKMALIENESESIKPVGTLCDNVLKVLAESPGRLYDGKDPKITPVHAAVDAAKGLVSPAADKE
jgi:hypothetical protein